MSLNYNRKFQTKFGPKYVLKLIKISDLSKSIKCKKISDLMEISFSKRKKMGKSFLQNDLNIGDSFSKKTSTKKENTDF